MEIFTTRPTKAVFKVGEACRYLGLSPNTLRKYADLGKIQCFRVGKDRMFNVEALDKFRQPDFSSQRGSLVAS